MTRSRLSSAASVTNYPLLYTQSQERPELRRFVRHSDRFRLSMEDRDTKRQGRGTRKYPSIENIGRLLVCRLPISAAENSGCTVLRAVPWRSRSYQYFIQDIEEECGIILRQIPIARHQISQRGSVFDKVHDLFHTPRNAPNTSSSILRSTNTLPSFLSP